MRTLHESLKVPITCKIRIQNTLERSIQYAQMLEKAGAQLLTVHGRTREQKGANTGVANWDYIKAVRENVNIPVIANGNIQCLEDVHRCIEYTGVAGVMSAEGNLTNPAIFDGINPASWEMAYEYLDLVDEYPAPNCYIRGHMFKIFHHLLVIEENFPLRERIAIARTTLDFKNCVKALHDKYFPYHNGEKIWESNNITFDLELPPWICQPYVRPPIEQTQQKIAEALKRHENGEKREYFDDQGNQISRKKMKKLLRKQRRPIHPIIPLDRDLQICAHPECENPMGKKCDFDMCRNCCRDKCYTEEFDCPGHKIFVKTRREKARYYENLEKSKATNEG